MHVAMTLLYAALTPKIIFFNNGHVKNAILILVTQLRDNRLPD